MKKFFAFAGALLAAASLSAATLPLSQSSTFTGLANRVSAIESGYGRLSGATFTGPLRGSAGVSRDAQFYFDLANNSTDPRLNFDTNDHFDYSRANNILSMTIGNNQVASLNSSGTLSSASWASTSYNGLVLGKNGSTGRPYVSFDGLPSRIEFVNGGAYVFYIGGTAVASLDGNGNLKVRGSVNGGQTTFP